ncbi:MAG: hypothetical protein ACK6DP_03230 [Gemmatimonas sp.]|uniref:hypothetical protein n=1 Tax=Gemmatimonas sp. TaxID=1962908 RepID=UPI00391F5CD8
MSFLRSVLTALTSTTAAPPRLRGIPVDLRNSRPDIRDADVLARLDEALALIERYQPHRFRHLLRDVRTIRVERFPTRGAFLPNDQVVLTELTFLARRDITAAPVASSILHEGVHARVHAFRARVMRGFPEAADMAREERLCRRAELAFGHALPPALGAPVIERAQATLTMTDQDVAPTVDWGLAMVRQRQVDADAQR